MTIDDILAPIEARAANLRGHWDENLAESLADIPTLCKLARAKAEVIAQLVEALEGTLKHSHEDSHCSRCDAARAALAAASAVNVKGEQT